MTDYLSAEEMEAMETMSKFAGQLRRIIGKGPCAAHDWAEAADKIHQLQAVVMAQAACRAYPALYRPLGGFIGDADYE